MTENVFFFSACTDVSDGRTEQLVEEREILLQEILKKEWEGERYQWEGDRKVEWMERHQTESRLWGTGTGGGEFCVLESM